MGKTDYIRTAVRLDFASHKADATDEIDMIAQGVDYAAPNLYHRYNVILEPPFITEEKSVVVYVKVPKEISENFSYGNRLRGISAYLLKHYRDRYEKYLVGNRLFFYTVIGHDYIPKSKDQSVIKLELITNFINLVTHSPADKLEQVEKALNKFM